MREAYECLARVIDYPTATLQEDATRCATVLERTCAEAAQSMSEFRFDIRSRSAGEIEEAYTALFDFHSDHSLYLGHHLFGEDWRRSMFMAELNHRYGESGFSCGVEMSDHLAVVLRFLAHVPDLPEMDELRTDCIIPAVRKALEASEARQGLYTPALRAVLMLFMQQGCGAQAA